MPVTIVVILALVTSIAAFIRAWRDHLKLTSMVASLEQKAREMQHRIEVRGKLAGEIAHEIKNPITAIQCSAETLDLMLGEKLQPELRKSLKYISEYSEYLLRLLTDFLEVSRCEAGVNVPKPEVVQISEVMDGVAALLRSYAMKKHITLSLAPLDKEIRAWADNRHVKQILFNLVHNAIKFTPAKGRIDIAATSEPHERFVTIAVRDSGKGIPEEELKRIFDPYRRYEGNQPLYDAGVGLGLGLCRNLVQMAHGEIHVESVPNQGTTFYFSLPKSPPISKEKPVPSKKTDQESALFQPLLGQSYLVVDEDKSTSDSVTELIKAWGGMVDQVSQAVDAVEAVTSKAYDAVMVDTTLDGMNAYELASLIRDHAHAHGTTIILATKTPPDESKAIECGADRTIEKPLKGERLLQSLLTAGKCQISH